MNSNNPSPAGQPARRLAAIDALRGFDMFFIMGGDAIFEVLAAVCACPVVQFLGAQMSHSAWNGFAWEDCIFPLFIFLAGASFPFSLAKDQALGRSRGHILLKILRRTCLLVLLGLVYNGIFTRGIFDARYPSVLARIGLAWGCAALLWALIPRRWAVHAGILGGVLVLWWAVSVLAVSDPSLRWTFENNVTGLIDRLVMPGKLYRVTFDPEGLWSTLPAILNAYAGICAGEFLHRLAEKGGSPWKTLGAFVLAALAAFGLAWFLSAGPLAIPVNKQLWTPSFVGVTVGVSLLLLAVFYVLADVLHLRRSLFFFTVIGMNPITIYMAQNILGFHHASEFLFGGVCSLVPGGWDKVAAAVCYSVTCWLFLLFLYRRKIFLKV